MSSPASNESRPVGFETDQVSVLGWTVPRPTGRWHQAIVVTSRHVWITPELAFATNEQLEASAAIGIEAFHNYVRSAGWVQRPPRVNLADVRALDWNETTGWMRIAAGEIIGAMIPDRAAGNRLHPLLKRAIAGRVVTQPGRT